MKILVTGTSGQLALSLAERAKGKANIVLVGRPDLDLEDFATFAPVLKSVAPDMVINAAAHTGVDQQEDEPERALAELRNDLVFSLPGPIKLALAISWPNLSPPCAR